jgi:uncharacterized damage-inducible protein DinB
MEQRSDVARLIDFLEAAYSGSPWHGPSLKDNLKGVTAANAARRSGSAHTIWELVLHLAAWRGEIARRLQGNEAGTPPEGDYPPAPQGEDASDAQWQKALAWLDDSQQRVLSAARALSDGDLQKPVLDHREHVSGEGATRHATLVGLLQHDAYHSGQIAVLRRM